MVKITALHSNKSKKGVTVLLDDSSSLTVSKAVAEDAGLRKGMALSGVQVKELLEAELYTRCFEAALRFLAYRPRSKREVQQRLHRRGFSDTVINKVVARLREQKLIDDTAFAQFWKESRLSSNPKSRRLLKYELMRKGISSEAADKATIDVDDSTSAYKAGLKKARLLSSLNYNQFRRRMENYLKWRGFGYEVIDAVSERLWREKEKL